MKLGAQKLDMYLGMVIRSKLAKLVLQQLLYKIKTCSTPSVH